MVRRDLFRPIGGDIIATLVTVTFFYLSRYSVVYQRLTNEIRSTFASGEEIKGGPKLNECTFLRARDLSNDATASNPVVIDRHMVPSGTWVGINVLTLHHNESYFRDPFKFKPERWISKENELSEEESKRMRAASMQFSLGSRGCAGKTMAYLENKQVIARTLWYFDIDLFDEGLDPVMVTEGQFGSRHAGPHLRFRPRGELWEQL